MTHRSKEALLLRSRSTPDRTQADIVKGFLVSDASSIATEASIKEQRSSLLNDDIRKLLRILFLSLQHLQAGIFGHGMHVQLLCLFFMSLLKGNQMGKAAPGNLVNCSFHER